MKVEGGGSALRIGGCPHCCGAGWRGAVFCCGAGSPLWRGLSSPRASDSQRQPATARLISAPHRGTLVRRLPRVAHSADLLPHDQVPTLRFAAHPETAVDRRRSEDPSSLLERASASMQRVRLAWIGQEDRRRRGSGLRHGGQSHTELAGHGQHQGALGQTSGGEGQPGRTGRGVG